MPGSRQRLIPTPPDALDPALADAVADFCEHSPEVESAYVCLVEKERDGREAERVLQLKVKLRKTVEQPDDSRPETLELLGRLAERHLDVARTLGFGVLAARAVPTWERRGLQLFTR